MNNSNLLINSNILKTFTLISSSTRPRVVNENVPLSTNKIAGLKEIPIFHIQDKSTLHPVDYFAVYRTKKITVIVPESEIELWPLALKITPSIYIESTKA